MAWEVIFTPHSVEYPASNYPTLDTRNNHPVLDFDDTTEETCYFTGVLPGDYGGGGLTVYLGYSMTTATSGDVDWDVAIERIGDSQQDVDSDGFAAANVVDNTTVPATSGHVDVVSITFTDGVDMDSLAAGELFRISVALDQTGGSSTATGDAELHWVRVQET